MGLKSGKLGLRNYLMLACLYEPYSLRNTKVIAAKDHGKKYIKVTIFSVIIYLVFTQPDYEFRQEGEISELAPCIGFVKC